VYEPGQALIQWINFPAIERPDAASKGQTTLIELAQDFDVHLLPAGVCTQTLRGEPDQAVARPGCSVMA